MNTVKELAGHADIATTAKFYLKVTAEHIETAKRISDDLLTTDHKLTISANLGQR
jgi:hypothetical protein